MSIEIQYENTLEDFAALSEHASRGQSKWEKIAYDWVFPLGVFVAFLFAGQYTLTVRVLWGLFAALLVRLVAVSPIGRWISYVVLWLHTRVSKGVLGEHRLRITDDGLVEQTPFNRTETPWSKVGPVADVGPYTMIRVKLVYAHIIPRDRILEGDLEPFLEQVRGRAEFLKPESSPDCSLNPIDSYPYATFLNVLYHPLQVVDVPALVDAVTDEWYNQTLCKVNDSVVRLGVMRGEYHWHKHDELDECFFVLEGTFMIDLEDRIVELRPWQGFVVPKGVVHRTRAPERCVILMVENAGIVPTGD